MRNLLAWPVRAQSLLMAQKLTREIADLESDIFS